ncbi:hypothetical protein G7Y89_g9382 [Cudoniella acicularis]|uniref:C2H2-type domain-containing protein n=1 Tax=Cudoniella acicularis TaxID=354080 RepID=A0A8H4W034_9HELO|nr:hypothetical protein G7Y89_g9382 [Cudoniella acicularis]
MSFQSPHDSSNRNVIGCDSCSTYVSRPHDLRRHKDEKHGPPKKCPECGHEVKRKDRLSKHMHQRHGYPSGSVILDIPKAFQSQGSYNNENDFQGAVNPFSSSSSMSTGVSNSIGSNEQNYFQGNPTITASSSRAHNVSDENAAYSTSYYDFTQQPSFYPPSGSATDSSQWSYSNQASGYSQQANYPIPSTPNFTHTTGSGYDSPSTQWQNPSPANNYLYQQSTPASSTAYTVTSNTNSNRTGIPDYSHDETNSAGSSYVPRYNAYGR